MTRAIDAVVAWVAISALLWFAAMCLIGVFVRADPGYALFAIAFAAMAWFLFEKTVGRR
jgi:hypothetical protein